MLEKCRQSCIKVLRKLPRNENGKMDFQSLKATKRGFSCRFLGSMVGGDTNALGAMFVGQPISYW